jgi:DNA-binding transcriptional MerR regulator
MTIDETANRLPIGEVAHQAGMTPSRLRYYERRGLIDPPDRHAGKRRYHPSILQRLAIIDAAQRVGFNLDQVKDLLGSRDGPAHERLRRLALNKLPEIDRLIVRATVVQHLLRYCADCHCASIEECKLLAERETLTRHGLSLEPNDSPARPSSREGTGGLVPDPNANPVPGVRAAGRA